MAQNDVKIVSIGKKPTNPVNANNISQKTVDGVINFWKKQLSQVLYKKPDLIVLPETAGISHALPFSGIEEFIEVRKDQLLNYFKSVAKKHHTYIAFGTMRKGPNGNTRNSLILLDRNGKEIGFYNKIHPTIYEMKLGTKPGNKPVVLQTDFGTVGLIICQDLMYDKLREAYAKLKPDVMIFSSAAHYTDIDQEVWSHTIRSFFVGSIAGSGKQQIRDPFGRVVAESSGMFDFAVATVNLDYRLIDLDYTKKGIYNMIKKYGNTVNIETPEHSPVAMVISSNKKVSSAEMLKEFGVETLSQFLKRTSEYSQTHDIKVPEKMPEIKASWSYPP